LIGGFDGWGKFQPGAAKWACVHHCGGVIDCKRRPSDLKLALTLIADLNSENNESEEEIFIKLSRL
jgi:hypothetical protein